MAFLPVSDVIFGFKHICDHAPASLSPVLDYFETYYIGKIDPVKQTRRKVPSFRIPMWNVYERVVADKPRTNNSIESWHKQFANDIHAHPTVNKLIKQFILEQKNTEVLLSQIRVGDQYERKKQNVSRDAKLKKLVLEYKKGNIDQWLEDMTFLLNSYDD